jgi:chromosome segregation ATPase
METAIGDIFTYFGIPGGVGVALYFILGKLMERNTARLEKEQEKLKEHQAEIEKKNEEVKRAQEEATSQRTRNRDLQIKQLEQKIDGVDSSFGKHVQGHVNFEKEIMSKMDAFYDRLNPIAENVAKIQGFLEAQQSKGTPQRKR